MSDPAPDLDLHGYIQSIKEIIAQDPNSASARVMKIIESFNGRPRFTSTNIRYNNDPKQFTGLEQIDNILNQMVKEEILTSNKVCILDECIHENSCHFTTYYQFIHPSWESFKDCKQKSNTLKAQFLEDYAEYMANDTVAPRYSFLLFRQVVIWHNSLESVCKQVGLKFRPVPCNNFEQIGTAITKVILTIQHIHDLIA